MGWWPSRSRTAQTRTSISVVDSTSPCVNLESQLTDVGPSSNVALLRTIVRAVGQPANNPGNNGRASLSRPSMDVQTGPASEPYSAFLRRPANTERVRDRQRRPVEPFALPPPDEADDLLRHYFATVNLMVPCIHEDSFRAMYRRARSEGLRVVRRSWLGVLNMMFAIATNVQTPISPPIERATRSDMYFERAVELSRPEILGRLSLELGRSRLTEPCCRRSLTALGTVQLFLLMEIYLQGTTYSSLAWTFHSLSVKGAYQLGLHFMGSTHLSPLDREVRRRLWYLCVMNDR